MPTPPNKTHEIEVLAAFVHGSLAAGHLLGLVYNTRKRNKLDMAMHSLALVYDLYAVHKHLKAASATITPEEPIQ